MRKLTIGVVIAIILGVGLILLQQDSKQGADQSTAAETPVSSSSNTETPSDSGGTYTDYDAATVAATPGDIILFFHASWCPQCRALDADIREKGVPDGITIFKVDYDTASDLRRQYEVTLQTTVVKIDAKGTQLSKFVPYRDPTLDSVLKNL